MTHTQYENRAREIDAWARNQYKLRVMSERQIENAVAVMFDALDIEYTGAIDVSYRQTFDSVW
jgi:hypothetical protein